MSQGAEADHRIDDKVYIREGVNRGERGRIVEMEDDGEVTVLLKSGATVGSSLAKLTNSSLVARLSWKDKPRQNTGRKPSVVPVKKMVSMRLEIEVWQRLGRAKNSGKIQSREQAVNSWIREQLDALGVR